MSRPPRRHVLIVGPGRLGLGIGAELLEGDATVRITYWGHAESAPDHPMFMTGAATYVGPGKVPSTHPDGVLITTPDGRIREAATLVAAAFRPPVPVLHTSGVLGPDPLAVLAERGDPVGSLHPLVSVANPVRDAHKLRGAWFGVEGDPGALELARFLVDALEGDLIRIDPGGKPLYHAAAVFASNYAVALLSVAERLMREAGVDPQSARESLTSLAAGAVQNVAAVGPVDALTGPICRGDAETVALHLGRLSGQDRPLYSVLARETLLLAIARGLAPDAAARLSDLLWELKA
ncbi:MAG: DUF2520 domain-containing protein [Gemmatimonas sp.]|nr:DUF2520 domain-containing protein [Gemmatimonas sp.]